MSCVSSTISVHINSAADPAANGLALLSAGDSEVLVMPGLDPLGLADLSTLHSSRGGLTSPVFCLFLFFIF